MKITGALLLTGVIILSQQHPAHAWSNGTDGCNSFGTHDRMYPLSVGLLAASLRSAARCALAALGAATSAARGADVDRKTKETLGELRTSEA